MTTLALARIALVHPLGDFGDRTIQGISTLLANSEWHIEADYHHGTIGDATIYRNTNANTKDAAPNWQWYGAIPTANIKAYKLAGAAPSPSALPGSHGESQTSNPPARAQGTVAAAKS